MKAIVMQSLKAKSAACLAAIGLAACLSGCQSEDPDITGKWTCPDTKGLSLEVEFKPTGDYIVTYANGMPPEHGKYERKRERIVYTPDAPPSDATAAAAADSTDTPDDTPAPPPPPKPVPPDKIVVNSIVDPNNGILLGHYNPAALDSQRFCTAK